MTIRDVIREVDRRRGKRSLLPKDHLYQPCSICGAPTPVHYLDSCEWVGCSEECLTTIEEMKINDRIDDRDSDR